MLKLNVPNMTCGHCAGSVEKAVKSIDPAASVSVDLATRSVTIGSAEHASRFADALVEAGYSNSES